MMWWMWLLVPLFPTNEVPMMEKVSVLYPVKGEVVSYAFQDELSPFVSVEGSTNEEGIVFSLQHVSLSSLFIPPLEVLTVVKGKTNTFLFDGWVLRVAPTNVNVSNLHPVADIYPLYDFWWIGWVLLGFGLVGGVILFFLARKKSVEEEKRLHYETLGDHLVRLKQTLESMEEKAYYSEVAYFLRRVLEEAYGFPAREMGSLEIDQLLSVEKEWKVRILDVLKWCDRVKYAKHTTSLEKRKQIFQESEEIYNYCLSFKKEES